MKIRSNRSQSWFGADWNAALASSSAPAEFPRRIRTWARTHRRPGLTAAPSASFNAPGRSFRAMRSLITDQHVVIGAWLCGLYVTNDAWQQQFAGKNANPDKCAEFIQAEIIPGLSAAKRATMPKMARIEHPPVLNAV